MAVSDARYQELLVRLREARERLAYSQREVAEALSRPQSYVSKCETGERRIDVVELADFATLYGQRLDYFVGTADWIDPAGVRERAGLARRRLRRSRARRRGSP